MGAAPDTFWNELLLGCSVPGWIHGGFEVLDLLPPRKRPPRHPDSLTPARLAQPADE